MCVFMCIYKYEGGHLFLFFRLIGNSVEDKRYKYTFAEDQIIVNLISFYLHLDRYSPKNLRFLMYSITSPTILDVKYYEPEIFSFASITYHSFSKTDDFQMCLITICFECADLEL